MPNFGGNPLGLRAIVPTDSPVPRAQRGESPKAVHLIAGSEIWCQTFRQGWTATGRSGRFPEVLYS